jgi:hypothetical protein
MGLVDTLLILETDPAWLPGLREAAAGAAISTAEEVRRAFGMDRWHAAAMPEVVVQAVTREQVAATLRYANEHGLPVTTRGAGVGYVGGCVPVKGGILLSVRQMNRIVEINPADGIAVVEPGVTLDGQGGGDAGMSFASQAAYLSAMAKTNERGEKLYNVDPAYRERVRQGYLQLLNRK